MFTMKPNAYSFPNLTITRFTIIQTTDCKNGIYLKNRSFNNSIHDNIIKNPTSSALKVNTGSSENMFHSNKIINSQQAKGIGNPDDNEKDELHGNFTKNTFRNNQLM